MSYFSDPSAETQIGPSEMAEILAKLNADVPCLVGKVAAVLLNTQIDLEDLQTDSELMARPYARLCDRLVKKFVIDTPFHELEENAQSADALPELCTVMPAEAVAYGLRLVNSPYSEILSLWAKYPTLVSGWIRAKGLAYGDDPAWIDACLSEVRLQTSAMNFGGSSQIISKASIPKEVKRDFEKLRIVVTRLYLANMRTFMDGQKEDWTPLGTEKTKKGAISELIEEQMQAKGLDDLKIDQCKKVLAVAIVETLGPAYVEERLPHIYARYIKPD